MKYRVLKPFGSKSSMSIYSVGDEVKFCKGSKRTARLLSRGFIKPLVAKKIELPNSIREMLQVWIDNNDIPIQEICFYLTTYHETGKVDEDGFYNYRVFGYVGWGYHNRTATSIGFRLREPLECAFDSSKDIREFLKSLTMICHNIFGGEIQISVPI